MDYIVDTTQVTFASLDSPATVEFSLNQDNIALEPNETFTLQLVETAGLNLDFFVFDTLIVTILDSDGERCSITLYISSIILPVLLTLLCIMIQS